MRFAEFHVFNSDRVVSINTETVSQVAELRGLAVAPHASIHRMDGGYVEVRETREQVIAALTEK